VFLQRKVYWQTLATGADVWIADETEAQYLDTTAHHLSEVAAGLAKQGLWNMGRAYAKATPKLLSQKEKFEADLKNALEELEKKHAFERG
jgi:hypothetical protein